MTEDKKILVKDITARLSYGVKLGFKKSNIVLAPSEYDISTNMLYAQQVYPEIDYVAKYGFSLYDYIPYLRPMESMTEEEEDELNSVRMGNYGEDVDFLNKHHFDYRGLIPMGLALEAPEGMYKTE